MTAVGWLAWFEALFALFLAGLAPGLLTASRKAYSTEARFSNLLDNGGTFGGDVTVNGDHSVSGNITSGNDLTVGGNTYAEKSLAVSDAVSIAGGTSLPGPTPAATGAPPSFTTFTQVYDYCNDLNNTLNAVRDNLADQNVFTPVS